jgi:hypothetical protein
MTAPREAKIAFLCADSRRFLNGKGDEGLALD